MKTIMLTRGYSALVDDSDFDFLSQWRWHVVISHSKHKTKVYAARNPGRGGCSKYVLMHRVLMDASNTQKVDHKDGNGLNNQRLNLRLCSHSQNLHNTGLSASNSSGFKGVSWCSCAKKWRARFVTNRKEHHLGLFNTKEAAAMAYDLAIVSARGDFSVTNESLSALRCH
jgi:hypothetical protein